MHQGYVQFGLVTNDFDKAMLHISQAHGIGAFKQMRELTIGARGDTTVTANFALAFLRGTQFEIIEPVAGDTDFYREALPVGDEFALRFHHLGRYCSTPKDYADARAGAAVWPCLVDHAIFDGSFCYHDARSTLGYYLEFYTFPPMSHFDGVPVF